MSAGLSAVLAGNVGTLALDVAFDAPPGATALVGRSGAGKTTILRCLAGLQRLAGTVKVGNDQWQDAGHFLPAEKRGVGMVFQGDNLLEHLTVRENLVYAARRAANPRLLSDIVAPTGIGHLLERRPATLSGGEAQRVAIARALLIRPSLLLLDEPLSALDGASRLELAEFLATLLPTLQIPVLLVSHDLADLSGLPLRRITLENGRIASTAPDPLAAAASVRT